MSARLLCFVTIQNNIVLKLTTETLRHYKCFVTIQNNIVLKRNITEYGKDRMFCYHSK